MAGTWTATLSNRELRVRLNESCEWLGAVFAGAGWVVKGDWQWNGMSGPAESHPFYFAGRTELTLASGTSPNSDRAIFTTDNSFPVGSTMSGTLSGSWSAPGAVGVVQVALFAKEPVVLIRQ